VMALVLKVVKDTSRGVMLDTVRAVAHLCGTPEGAPGVGAVATHTTHLPEKERQYLRFLRRIGAGEEFTDQVLSEGKVRMGTQKRYRLTPRVASLFTEVMGRA